MEKPILFYDGVCGLCDRSVQFLLKRDKAHKLHFSPLQGETAKTLLTTVQREQLASVVLWEDKKTYEKSQAMLRVLAIHLGWSWVKVFFYIPKPVSDFFYHLIADNRYHLFEKMDVCRLPTPEEKASFLP